MSMNVQVIMVAVLIIVTILLGPIPVAVIQDIVLIVMAIHVKVIIELNS